MRRRLQFFIACTFLSATLSANPGSAAYRAAMCERQIFEQGFAAPAALFLEKASCYLEDGNCKDAASTLERIRLGSCSESERIRILALKADCALKTGNYKAACAFCAEAGLPKPENPGRKTAAEWVWLAAQDGLAACWIVGNCMIGNYVSAVTGGCLGLYFGLYVPAAEALSEL